MLGHTWRENEREMREWLGISLQETRLSEKLTVRETIELFASFYRQPRSSDEVLEQLQLTEKADSWVGKLSGGQRQRLAVATALVCNPKILFLDEPTTGLDPQSRRQLWDIIRAFQRDGGTVLLTTHYMDEAERLCDRLAIVDHGQIIAEGSPADLIERLGGHHVVEFSVSGDSDGAALQAWTRLAQRRIRPRGRRLGCVERQATAPDDSRAARCHRQAGKSTAASDHAPGQPGRCFCAVDGKAFARE